MTPNPPPVDQRLRILSNVDSGASHFLMTLMPADAGRAIPRWAPGQFVMITPGLPPGASDPLLRRPFSIFNLPDDPPDTIRIFYKILGRGTEMLSLARPGQIIRCLGPLGNGFSPDRPAGARLLLVAGGIGSASLHPLALAEKAAGRDPLVLYGCRTGSEVAGIRPTMDCGIETRIATDDGSQGHEGFVSGLLDDFLSTEGSSAPSRWVICACGPTPMMKATAAVAARHRVRCYLSLESPMACGFGVCVGCVVGTRESATAPLLYRRICVEGPVFDAAQVCW